MSDHTPAMREGNTDDTMSDSAVFQRPPRRVSGREQWMTTSDFGSPLSSSTAQSTSMPSLEQPTTSFQEGSGQASLNQTSSSRGSSQGEWSSVDEDEPSITASVAFRGEIFALNATSNLSDTDHVPPKGIAQGMQIPARKEALLREFDGHIERRTYKIVDRPPSGTPIMQSFMLQSNKYDEQGSIHESLQGQACGGWERPDQVPL